MGAAPPSFRRPGKEALTDGGSNGYSDTFGSRFAEQMEVMLAELEEMGNVGGVPETTEGRRLHQPSPRIHGERSGAGQRVEGDAMGGPCVVSPVSGAGYPVSGVGHPVSEDAVPWTEVSRRRTGPADGHPEKKQGQGRQQMGWGGKMTGNRQGIGGSIQGFLNPRPKQGVHNPRPKQSKINPNSNTGMGVGGKANIKFATATMGSSWRDVCAPVEQSNTVSGLRYIKPSFDDKGTPFALIPSSVVKNNAAKWATSLVGYVMGDRPYYMHLKACVNRLWKTTCSLDVYVKDNCSFIFKFGTEEECKRILQTGPWFFNGRLIVLRRWKTNMGLERDMFGSVPIWVRFPHLPLDYWDAEGISGIASVIGTPLAMDEATTKENRLGYARCFVEVKASALRPTKISVKTEDGGTFEASVEYEWIPPSCALCECFGHLEASCPMKKVWKPRSSEEENKEENKELESQGNKRPNVMPLQSDKELLSSKEITIEAVEVENDLSSDVVGGNPANAPHVPESVGKVEGEVESCSDEETEPLVAPLDWDEMSGIVTAELHAMVERIIGSSSNKEAVGTDVASSLVGGEAQKEYGSPIGNRVATTVGDSTPVLVAVGNSDFVRSGGPQRRLGQTEGIQMPTEATMAKVGTAGNHGTDRSNQENLSFPLGISRLSQAWGSLREASKDGKGDSIVGKRVLDVKEVEQLAPPQGARTEASTSFEARMEEARKRGEQKRKKNKTTFPVRRSSRATGNIYKV